MSLVLIDLYKLYKDVYNYKFVSFELIAGLENSRNRISYKITYDILEYMFTNKIFFDSYTIYNVKNDNNNIVYKYFSYYSYGRIFKFNINFYNKITNITISNESAYRPVYSNEKIKADFVNFYNSIINFISINKKNDFFILYISIKFFTNKSKTNIKDILILKKLFSLLKQFFPIIYINFVYYDNSILTSDIEDDIIFHEILNNNINLEDINDLSNNLINYSTYIKLNSFNKTFYDICGNLKIFGKKYIHLNYSKKVYNILLYEFIKFILLMLN